MSVIIKRTKDETDLVEIVIINLAKLNILMMTWIVFLRPKNTWREVAERLSDSTT